MLIPLDYSLESGRLFTVVNNGPAASTKVARSGIGAASKLGNQDWQRSRGKVPDNGIVLSFVLPILMEIDAEIVETIPFDLFPSPAAVGDFSWKGLADLGSAGA